MYYTPICNWGEIRYVLPQLIKYGANIYVSCKYTYNNSIYLDVATVVSTREGEREREREGEGEREKKCLMNG